MGKQPTKPGWYPHRYGEEGRESYWNGKEWTGESRRARRKKPNRVWFLVGIVAGLLTTFVGFVGAAGGNYAVGSLFFVGPLLLVVTLSGGLAVSLDKRRRDR